ncbi:MAG: hypothetical protein U5K51_10640 [Flavobacteriaceae bacterium]|nr:hypothetical protein [Flavobacteriaceae bacterium]
MKELKNIGILGCGWLGQKLARHFNALGHMVYTTNTSIEKSGQMRKGRLFFLFGQFQQ